MKNIKILAQDQQCCLKSKDQKKESSEPVPTGQAHA